MRADMLRAIQSLLVVMALVATASEAVALPEWPWPGVDVPICPMLDERGEGFESLGHLYALDVSDPNPTRKIPQRWCDTVYRVKATEVVNFAASKGDFAICAVPPPSILTVGTFFP